METIEQGSGLPQPLLRCPDLQIKALAQTVTLDDLRDQDLLLIQTANSVYSFLVLNAKEKSGRLMGGRLGNLSTPAWLIGSRRRKRASGRTDGKRLATGLCAVFMVSKADDACPLITSAIKRLTHIQPAVCAPATLGGDKREH